VTTVEPSRRDAVSEWLELFVRLLALPAAEATLVRDELEDHLRSRVDDLLIVGLTEPEAVRQAVAELGETATLARGFQNARLRPRKRRMMMHAALLVIAGSTLTMSSIAVFSGDSAPEPVLDHEAAVTTDGLPPSIDVLPETMPVVKPELTNSDLPMTGLVYAGATPPWNLTPDQIIYTPTIEIIPTVIPNTVVPAPQQDQFGDSLVRYDVSVLVGAGGPLQDSHAGAALLEVIRDLVARNQWEANGGSEARASVVGNTLFVNGDEVTQAGVKWVLESLRKDNNRMIQEQQAAKDAAQLAHEKTVVEETRERERAMQEMREAYEQLRHQLVALEQQRFKIDTERQALEAQIEAVGMFDDTRAAMSGLIARTTEIEIRTDDARERLKRVRSLLMSLEFGQDRAQSAPMPSLFGRARPARIDDAFSVTTDR